MQSQFLKPLHVKRRGFLRNPAPQMTGRWRQIDEAFPDVRTALWVTAVPYRNATLERLPKRCTFGESAR